MGLFAGPTTVDAGFFDYLPGTQVSAQTNPLDSIENSQNSQTMGLLEANVSSAHVLQDKNIKTSKDSSSEVKEDADVAIFSDNALMPTVSPTDIAVGLDSEEPLEDQVSVYVVRKGDSIGQIAKMFDVSVDTILTANDMKKGEKLVEGDVLFILPISGIEHTVTKGQTLKSIAALYKVDVSDITGYNDILETDALVVGDKLVIPGADMLSEGGDKPSANLGSSIAKDKNYYATHPVKGVAGYFIDPVPTGHKTQGLHGPGNRGIDIGAPTGTPIYAAASGKVLIAKTGWSGGYGNMAIVQHSNGTKTLYAHMVRLGTKTGARVSQGEIIGYVGSTGRSTGPHLHFEVFGAKNPGSDWSWKK